MKAVVVTAFDRSPQCLDRPEPRASEGSMVVDLVAAGLHPRVRSQATGTHYTSTDELPLVPGIDGVGRDSDGRLRYFVLPDTASGAMSERVLIDPRRSVVLPDGADPHAVAAGMNPAMSSWVAVRRRITFTPGASALVIGAAGNAGRLAVQVVRHLGASVVYGMSRDPATHAAIADLGAIPLSFSDAVRAADVDVVLDYVWGEQTSETMTALVSARKDRGRRLDWVAIGSVGGPSASIPSEVLRASGLAIVGSGQGSVPTEDILAELPAIAAALTDATLSTGVRRVRMRDVEREWALPPISTEQVVIVP